MARRGEAIGDVGRGAGEGGASEREGQKPNSSFELTFFPPPFLLLLLLELTSLATLTAELGRSSSSSSRSVAGLTTFWLASQWATAAPSSVYLTFSVKRVIGTASHVSCSLAMKLAVMFSATELGGMCPTAGLSVNCASACHVYLITSSVRLRMEKLTDLAPVSCSRLSSPKLSTLSVVPSGRSSISTSLA